MQEDSREDEFNCRIRRDLYDWFGSFEEFHDRVAKSQQNARHGLIRAKMKPRIIVSVQATPHESPSHIPVHVALQSMRNLVEEPLSALPQVFADLQKGVSLKKVTIISDKKRKMGEDDSGIDAKRKKERILKHSIPSSTPDSGVHSTESELLEEVSSEEVAAILNIMKTLDEPKLSPIPESLLIELQKEFSAEKKKSMKRIENADNSPLKITKTTRFLSDSPVSSASTSRESTPESKNTGNIKLHVLKPERVQKLLEIAKANGRLLGNGRIVKKISDGREKTAEKSEKFDKSEKVMEKSLKSEKSEGSIEKKNVAEEPHPSTSSGILPPPLLPSIPLSTTPSVPPFASKDISSSEVKSSTLPPLKATNKTVQNLQIQSQNENSSRNLSPSNPSPSSIRSTTPTVLSRPSSSLSTYENPPNHAANSEVVATTSSEQTRSQSKTRWVCQWDRAKMKVIQRIPIPEPISKSKGEFYHGLAKDWKSKADRSKDRVIRPLNYMLSSVFFVLEAIWKTEKDRTAQSRMQCASIYRDTYELLGVAVFQGVRETDETLAVHLLPRIKVLGQIMLSVMQYQMYLFRAEQAIKTISRLEMREVSESIEIRQISRTSDTSTHCQPLATVPTNKVVNSVAHGTPKPSPSAGSTPSGPAGQPVTPWVASVQNCQQTVTMPQIVFDAYKSQLKTSNSLILASRYWEDSKILARHVDSTFIKDIETVCGKSIGMDMPFDVLAQFVLTAVGSLKAEYEEEKMQPVKPILSKVKKELELALRTGAFHSDRPHSTQRPSQTTPQPKK